MSPEPSATPECFQLLQSLLPPLWRCMDALASMGERRAITLRRLHSEEANHGSDDLHARTQELLDNWPEAFDPTAPEEPTLMEDDQDGGLEEGDAASDDQDSEPNPLVRSPRTQARVERAREGNARRRRTTLSSPPLIRSPQTQARLERAREGNARRRRTTLSSPSAESPIANPVSPSAYRRQEVHTPPIPPPAESPIANPASPSASPRTRLHTRPIPIAKSRTRARISPSFS